MLWEVEYRIIGDRIQKLKAKGWYPANELDLVIEFSDEIGLKTRREQHCASIIAATRQEMIIGIDGDSIIESFLVTERAHFQSLAPSARGSR